MWYHLNVKSGVERSVPSRTSLNKRSLWDYQSQTEPFVDSGWKLMTKLRSRLMQF